MKRKTNPKKNRRRHEGEDDISQQSTLGTFKTTITSQYGAGLGIGGLLPPAANDSADQLRMSFDLPSWTTECDEYLDGILTHPEARRLVTEHFENVFDAWYPIDLDDLTEREARILKTRVHPIESQLSNVMSNRSKDAAYDVVQTTTRNTSTEKKGDSND